MTGETFRATVIGQFIPQATAIVFDFGYADLAGSAHVDTGTAAGNFQTLVQATLAAALPANYRFLRYRFACVGGTHVGEIGYVEVGSVVAGTLDDDNLPPEMCISMKRSTGHASRRDRGRIFFGPVATQFRVDQDSDFIDPTESHLVAVATLLKTDLTVGPATLKPVILNAAGAYSGNVVIHTAVAPILVHHKSRRTRGGA